MNKTKKVTITLKTTTIKRLANYATLNSINKSALIDKLINEELNKKEKI